MFKENYLNDVLPDEAFYCHDGTYLRNIYELCDKLKNISDEQFKEYTDKSHNDIAYWIGVSLGDRVLASRLQGITSKEKFIAIIRSRIRVLETRKKLLSLVKFEHPLHKTKPILTFLLILLILVNAYSIYTNDKQYKNNFFIDKEMNVKLQNFISKQIVADNILFKHLVGIETLMNNTMNKTFIDVSGNLIENPFAITPPKPPTSRIDKDKVYVTNKSIIIFIKNPVWAKVADTKSMEPVLVGNSYVLEMKPKSFNDLKEGDIISYKDKFSDLIIHRIVGHGFDDDGWYAITKGDNNLYKDPDKVRFSQINGVLFGILY